MSAAYDLSRLTDEQAEILGRNLEAVLDEQYASDPWAWLCEQVVTKDEADKLEKRWPAEKDYLHDLIDILQSDEHKICIPKSRRMLVTWAVAAWCTWSARYHRNNAIFWQSQNEEKAAYVIDKRCAFIEDHLRVPQMRRPYTAIHTSGGLIGNLTYELTQSYLWSVAQGADVGRSFTPSAWVMDEVDFQDKGHSALASAIPLAEKAAKIILITTSNGPLGVVASICKEAGFTRFR
jgi:hypothetical protein